MKISRVALTPPQAAWLSRNVAKMLQLLEASEKKNKGVQDRTTYKTLLGIKGKAAQAGEAVKAFGLDEQYEVDLNLTKKEKGVLKTLIGSVHRGLVEKVIPEYVKRGESHDEYRISAITKADLLESLWRKFK